MHEHRFAICGGRECEQYDFPMAASKYKGGTVQHGIYYLRVGVSSSFYCYAFVCMCF